MKVAVEVTVLLSGGDAVGEQDIERLKSGVRVLFD